MSSRTGIVVVVLAALAAPLATAGAARKSSTVEASPLLWATINICDPAERPDTIGIRASMPGAADGRERMFMRFRVQYFSDADQKWHNVTQGGDSGWRFVGLARYEARRSGRDFRFAPPTDSPSILLRGKVNFEWRLKGEVTRRASKLTTKGHSSKVGSVPPGYTAETCTIMK